MGSGNPIETAKHLILEAIGETTGVQETPALEAIVVDLAGSSVKTCARWWVAPPRRSHVLDLPAIASRSTSQISWWLTGIDLPLPTRQI